MAAPASHPNPPVSGLPKSPKKVAEAGGGLVGAAAGAAVGAIAGPAGIVGGAVLGAIAGAATGRALIEIDEKKAAKEAQLDDEIGVTKGDLGAAQTNIPARIGAPSLGSVGVAEPENPSEDGGAGVVGGDEETD